MYIGLVGHKRSGKSTAAQFFIERGFIPVNFKDGLVREIKQNFPRLLNLFSEHYGLTIDDLFSEKPPAVRFLLQEYGTEVRRGDDDSYWVDKWNDMTEDLINVVVDDVRFLNEAEAIKNSDGFIIKIKRKDCQRDSHKSETEMDKIVSDVIIDNNGTIEDLNNKLEVIWKKLAEKNLKNLERPARYTAVSADISGQ